MSSAQLTARAIRAQAYALRKQQDPTFQSVIFDVPHDDLSDSEIQDKINEEEQIINHLIIHEMDTLIEMATPKEIRYRTKHVNSSINHLMQSISRVTFKIILQLNLSFSTGVGSNAQS